MREKEGEDSGTEREGHVRRGHKDGQRERHIERKKEEEEGRAGRRCGHSDVETAFWKWSRTSS